MVALLPFEAVRITVLPGVAVPLTTLVPTGCVVFVAGLRIATDGGPTAVTVTCVWAVPLLALTTAVMVLVPTGRFTPHEY